MKRLFNKKQKLALELYSQGKCMICGCLLLDNFHADHIKPFSKNGTTDVINGQALCPKCNLEKGNKMSIQLHQWQQDALNKTLKVFNDGNKLSLTHATPGGGKTIHGLSVFNALPQTHLIIVVPSKTLVLQWQSEAKEHYNIELKTKMLYQQQSDFHEYQGIVMTYQAMNENHENLRMFCNSNSTLVIADEIHHVSDGQSWGDAFKNAFELSDCILGLTGTPWTTKGKKISFVNYDNNGKAIPDYSYLKQTAIKDNVCRAVQFQDQEVTDLLFSNSINGDTSKYLNLDDAMDDDVHGAYRKVQQDISHLKPIFSIADSQLSRLRRVQIDAGGLLVAPDIRTATIFQTELFMLTGIEFPLVHSDMLKPQDVISAFKKGTDRWLISVDMITEGVDIKRLQVCIFLSIKLTELFLRQVIGRIERIRFKGKESDKTAYFYYTKTNQAQKFIDRFVKENEAGIELRQEKEKELIDENEKLGSTHSFIEDGVTLDEFNSSMNTLTVNGYNFDKDIVIEAIRRRNSDPRLDIIPLYHICLIIMNEIDGGNDNYKDDIDNTPTEVKKKRLRTIISKTINKKLFSVLKSKPSGKDVQNAHCNINRMTGIKGTDDGTSLEMLEKKYKIINDYDPKLWVNYNE